MPPRLVYPESLTFKGIDPRQKETVAEALEAFALHCPFLWTTSSNFMFKWVKVYNPSYPSRSSWAPSWAHRYLTNDYNNFRNCYFLRVVRVFFLRYSHALHCQLSNHPRQGLGLGSGLAACPP